MESKNVEIPELRMSQQKFHENFQIFFRNALYCSINFSEVTPIKVCKNAGNIIHTCTEDFLENDQEPNTKTGCYYPKNLRSTLT